MLSISQWRAAYEVYLVTTTDLTRGDKTRLGDSHEQKDSRSSIVQRGIHVRYRYWNHTYSYKTLPKKVQLYGG